MADIQAVAKAFVEFYYSTFDRNRAELVPLYVSLDVQCAWVCFWGTHLAGLTERNVHVDL